MRRTKIVVGFVAIVFSLSLAFAPVIQAKTYKDLKTYTLKGRVSKVTFYHPNGSKLTNYVLKLNKAIKIKSDYMGTIKVKALDISTMNSKKVRKKIKKKLGKKVKIKGEIFAPGTAWWYNTFVIEPKNAKCIK